MAEIKKLCKGSTVENDHEVEKYSRQLLKELSQENDEKLESGDKGVVYYVSGFVSKSLMKNEKCEECINLWWKIKMIKVYPRAAMILIKATRRKKVKVIS